MRLHHSDCGLWGIDSLTPNLVGWTSYPAVYAVIFDLCILPPFIQKHVKQTRLYSKSISHLNACITQQLCTASLRLFSCCSRLIEDSKLPQGVSVWVNCVFFIIGEQSVQSVFLPSDCWDGLQHPLPKENNQHSTKVAQMGDLLQSYEPNIQHRSHTMATLASNLPT